MKRTFAFLLAAAFAASTATAQETTTLSERLDETDNKVGLLENEVSKLKNFKVSGYIQTQFQWGQEEASLKVGTANSNPDKGFNRIGIRRGRIKFGYELGIASAVFQLDLTEKGVGVKDAYLNLKDPWFNTMMIRAGVFDRPFGYEISYSSSRRESPERSTVFQTLFPDERDLGAMLVLQAAKTSPWNILKLEAGIFAGNGIKQETDSHKDFIGHLSMLKNWNSVSLGGGVSYYNGGVYQGTANVYTMSGNEFVLNAAAGNLGKFAKREYFGADLEFTAVSPIGMTKLNAEYLWGQQPGVQGNSKSPNASALPTSDTYIRKFNGGYAMLVQYIGKTPLAVVGKYDWYNPNTKVSGDETGLNGTGAADLAQHTWGFGALVNFNPGMRLTAYYELNRNEKSANVAGSEGDRKNDVFTLRLQFKF